MARTAEKVESLIEDDQDFRNALATIYERSEGGANAVEWGDVREDLTSGQWGRLIETGVLVDGEGGFQFADTSAIEEVLDEETLTTPQSPSDSDIDEEETDASWTTWDKAAALGSVGLFAGYSLGSVRNTIGGIINVLLGPLDALLPFYAVIMILAVITGLYSTLLQANLMDMEVMSKYQSRMKDIQERQKAAKERGDDEAVERIRKEQMEAMGDQLGMFKAQFRPMVWIMLLTVPAFLWMYWKILPGGSTIIGPNGTVIMPFVGEVTDWQQGVIGPIQAWIVWYFLSSMAFTQVIRKALNIQTTPT